MKYLTLLLIIFLYTNLSNAQEQPASLKSPDGTILMQVKLNAGGIPVYSIDFKGKQILGESSLGLKLEDADFTKGLKIESVSDAKPIHDEYSIISGKRKNCVYNGLEKIIRFINESNQPIDFIIRLSNDGAAFRYFLPEKSSEIKKITEEATSFKFNQGTKIYMGPCPDVYMGWCNSQPSYEDYYFQGEAAGKPSPYSSGWVFPALFQKDNTWILLTETGLDGTYCGSRLQQNSENGNYKIAFPKAGEQTSPLAPLSPESTTPWLTPWRIIVISGGLKSMMESTLETDLAIPAKEADCSFVQPGRASWSWIMKKDDSITYDVQKRYIDWAAQMKWEYCLIDADWDTKIGYDNVKELADYAAAKGVGLLLWYNSAGSWNTVQYHPKDRLLFALNRQDEFKSISEMGIKGIKVDFFGGDGQSMMKYYNDILQDALKYKLVVNFHGTTYPRGWQRTYPNLVTMEAVRGFEFITFTQDGADQEPNHACMLPFTRNVFSPMDFTPVNLSEIPGLQRKTSSAFELALTVIFQSAVQHWAESPEGMAKMPDYIREYMSAVPTQWDDTYFIDGFPGKFVVMARKSGKTWYVAGINGETTPKEISFSLPFVTNDLKATLYTDGETNRSFSKSEIQFKKGEKTSMMIKPTGGFVMRIEE
ncbi:MAG: glycoside hydrolase family 97 catalytic domain-containing protein [Bacteroidales bacterium]|nr:glycoside hydrolase family 97 catalytic domain-containing protein [Bacteroidales bacterium]